MLTNFLVGEPTLDGIETDTVESEGIKLYSLNEANSQMNMVLKSKPW